MDVAELPVRVPDLAEQKCAPVAETGRVPAKLVAGVGLRHRAGPCRDGVADQQKQTLRAPEKGRIEAQLGGEVLVEHQKVRVGSLLRAPRNGHLLELPGEAAIKCDG